MYYFVKRNSITIPADHAEHAWEEWHAYLSSDHPEWVNADDTGVCCHTCGVVIVD